MIFPQTLCNLLLYQDIQITIIAPFLKVIFLKKSLAVCKATRSQLVQGMGIVGGEKRTLFNSSSPLCTESSNSISQM